MYAAGEWLGAHLPEAAGRRLFDLLAALAYRTTPQVRATVASNMSRVLGRPPESHVVRVATREAFRLYARYWLDTFRLRVMPPAELERRFICDDLDRLDRVLEGGKGGIVVLPHMGNWDAAGAFLVAHGYRLASVAEVLRPPRLARLFLAHREQLGMHIIPLDPNGRVGSRLAGLLARNWLVGLVADRDLSRRGIEVEMFGATRRIPTGPALLSLTTGAPLMVCPVSTTEDGWRCSIGEPLSIDPSGDTRKDVAALSRLMAEAFERAIAARPADWHMFQRGWES